MKPIIILLAGLSAGGILPAVGLVRASTTISQQNDALDASTAALKRLMVACDHREAVQDELLTEMRRGRDARDRLIAQLRGQSLEPSHER